MSSTTFDAAAHMRKIRTRQGMMDYLDIKWRILWLRSEHPDTNISTELVEQSATHARFKATISYYDSAGCTVLATGHGSETEQDFPDFFEKAETKAIGRACAVLGYGTDAATDFDDETPRDGAGAAKAELREPTPMEPRQRAEVDAAHEEIEAARAMYPEIAAARRKAVPDFGDSGYPAVSRQHGVNTMVDVNDYLHKHEFKGGNKGECIRELQATFKADIRPAHGRTEADGTPTIFPGDIYDFAAFHIDRMSERPLALEDAR